MDEPAAGSVAMSKWTDKYTQDDLMNWSRLARCSFALPQTCRSTDHKARIFAVGDPMESQAVPMKRSWKSQDPQTCFAAAVLRCERPVPLLLAESHPALGCTKTHIPTSTNGVWSPAPGQAAYLQTGAKISNVSSISLDGGKGVAGWNCKRGSFGQWMACPTCVWRVQTSMESGAGTGVRTAALVTPS
jgi:hypothetical protein